MAHTVLEAHTVASFGEGAEAKYRQLVRPSTGTWLLAWLSIGFTVVSLY